jgi:hypothetical protein
VDGTLLAIRSHPTGHAAGRLIPELEVLLSAEAKQWSGLVADFLESDPAFQALTGPARSLPRLSEMDQVTEAEGWVQATRRELFTYLNFLDALWCAFAPVGPIADLVSGKGTPETFEGLAEARRRMEVDPVAGWRRLTQAREELGLPCP